MDLKQYDCALFEDLDAVQEKIDTLIRKNQWSMQIKKDAYPITITFRKGFGAFDKEESDNTVPQIQFCFRSAVEYTISAPDDWRVDDKFFGKLKNLSKELVRLYLLVWFSRKNYRYENMFHPMWETIKGDIVGIMNHNYQP